MNKQRVHPVSLTEQLAKTVRQTAIVFVPVAIVVQARLAMTWYLDLFSAFEMLQLAGLMYVLLFILNLIVHVTIRMIDDYTQ